MTREFLHEAGREFHKSTVRRKKLNVNESTDSENCLNFLEWAALVLAVDGVKLLRSHCLWKRERAGQCAFRAIAYFARVKFCPFSLLLGVRDWLWFVIVALPGIFIYFFYSCTFGQGTHFYRWILLAHLSRRLTGELIG